MMRTTQQVAMIQITNPKQVWYGTGTYITIPDVKRIYICVTMGQIAVAVPFFFSLSLSEEVRLTSHH